MPTAAGVEGDIELRLGVAGNEVRRISVHSTRPLAACAVLHGRPVAESLRLLPALFSVCGKAQAYAGLSACEDALAMAPEPAQHAARRLLLLAEVAQEHCWRVSVDWPKLVGKNPDVAALAALRKPLAELPAFLYPEGDGLRPGGGRLVVDGVALADAIEAFAGQVGVSILAGWRGGADVGGLCRWAAETETPAARFLHRVMAEDMAGFGSGRVGLMPDPDLAGIAAAMAADTDGSFVARPRWRDAVYETGPLARMSGQPLIAAIMERFANGLLARFAARLVELDRLMEDMRALLPHLSAAPAAPADRGGSGVGAAAVEAARGLLVHRVELTEGRVGRYQILAPTEWNFHPEGPLVEGLRGAAAGGDIAWKAAMLVGALDPCVGAEVIVEEDGGA